MPDDYDAMKAFGVLCSGNQETSHAYANLILLGQRIAKFHLYGETMPGVMLKEHRRCAKPIIAYCNELCYEGKLIGLTNEEPSPFPRMGYAHIKGQVDQIGKSKRNKQEATAIATWLAKHQQAIVNACGEPSIDKCVGLITPYRAQSEFLKEELARHNLYLDKVGTVHSLQGAEKPIVIFSPVYTDNLNNNRTNFFFAKSANMLNVVVSRAKRSFLVFGDMDILDPKAANRPLALLARHLFADEENEITDVPPVQFTNVANPEKIEHITQLARHREILTKSFPRSNNELVIVSPFLRKRAIEADNILQLIKNNAKKKRITIYTVPYMNKKCHSEFMEMKTLLESHGASVVFVRNVHSKILAIDDRAVVIGSFNWLSAARYDKRYINEEVSLLYTGANVKQVIEDSLLPVKKKALQRIT